MLGPHRNPQVRRLRPGRGGSNGPSLFLKGETTPRGRATVCFVRCGTRGGQWFLLALGVFLCVKQDVFSGGAVLPGVGLRGMQRVWRPGTRLLGATGRSRPPCVSLAPGCCCPQLGTAHSLPMPLVLGSTQDREAASVLSGRRAEEGAGGRGFSEGGRGTGSPGAGPLHLLQRGLQGGLGGGASGVSLACAWIAGSAGTQPEGDARSGPAGPRLACPQVAAECPLSTHWPGWRVTADGRSGPQPKFALRLRVSGPGN